MRTVKEIKVAAEAWQKVSPAFDYDGCYSPVEYCEIGTLSNLVSKDDRCELHYKTINKALRENRKFFFEMLFNEGGFINDIYL